MKKDERIILEAIANCSTLVIPCIIEITQSYEYPAIVFEKEKLLRSLIQDQQNIEEIGLLINMSFPTESSVVINFKQPRELPAVMSRCKDQYEMLELYMPQDFWKIILESEMDWEKEYLLSDIKEIVNYKCALEWEDVENG